MRRSPEDPARAEMLSACIATAQIEACDRNEAFTVACCAGPPLCSLQGDAAQRRQVAGCRFCSIVRVLPDGTVATVQEPSFA